MDSNDGYIKLETTQDKVRKLWAKISIRAKAEQELKIRIKRELAELETRKTKE